MIGHAALAGDPNELNIRHLSWVTTALDRTSFIVSSVNLRLAAQSSRLCVFASSRTVAIMASPSDNQNDTVLTLDEPATDTASSSGPSLEIDVRPTPWHAIALPPLTADQTE